MTEEEKKFLEEQQKMAASIPESAAIKKLPDFHRDEIPESEAIKKLPDFRRDEIPKSEAIKKLPESTRYLDEILKQYEERKRQNEEADRYDRTASTIRGIGNMAAALSNLYFTTQYAPSGINAQSASSMSERERARVERAKANRDANLDQWMHYVLNVAGKKQAAEQAERNRQDTKAWREQEQKRREQEQEQRAQAAALEKQEKADQQWVSDYLVPDWEMEYDKYNDVAKAKAAIEADLDDRHKKGEITDGQLAAAKKRLEPTLKKRRNAKYSATEKQNQSIETSQRRAAATAAARGNNGGGNRSNTHQYVGFADGSGVWINKNDVSDITSLYDRADFPEAYKAKDGYGNVKTNLSREDKLNAVIHYLSLNRNNSYENWLRQVEKRPRTTTKPQQPKTSSRGSMPGVGNNNTGKGSMPGVK